MPLIQCDFFSEVLGLSTSMNVILPQPTQGQIGMQGAAGGAFGRRKVLYLLHGLSDDHTIWQRRTSIERYAAPRGLTVVMPAAGRSFYANMHSGPRYWDFVSDELPAICRDLFGVSNRREDCFVAGLSMGGYGAFKLALSYPDRFAAAASLSGVMDLAGRVQALGDGPLDGREMQMIFGDLQKVAGSDQDLLHLAAVLASTDAPPPRLFMWCGTEDFLLHENRTMHAHLQQLGIDHTYNESPGGHDWACWDAQIDQVLAWML